MPKVPKRVHLKIFQCIIFLSWKFDNAGVMWTLKHDYDNVAADNALYREHKNCNVLLMLLVTLLFHIIYRS